VIDIPAHGRTNPDYLITVDDVLAWEKAHGQLHANCIVIIRTGRYEHWSDTARYYGAASMDDYRHLNELGFPDRLHWPALHHQTAQWILDNRGMTAVGTDAASFDYGNIADFANSVHTVVLGSNRPGIENLNNIGHLPNRGATILALPLKLDAASGSPARIIAYGWQGVDDPCRYDYSSTTAGTSAHKPILLLTLVTLFLIHLY